MMKNMMRMIIALVLFLALNILVLSGSYVNQEKFGAVPQPLFSAVPDFSWQDLSGKRHNIRELSGHVVVIHFWAAWCAPCRKEFPDLLDAAKSMDKNVVFLTLSSDDTREVAEKFIHSAQESAHAPDLKNVLYGFDTDKKIAFDIFQTEAYPESIVVDPQGNMKRKFAGMVNWKGGEMAKYLKSLTVAVK